MNSSSLLDIFASFDHIHVCPSFQYLRASKGGFLWPAVFRRPIGRGVVDDNDNGRQSFRLFFLRRLCDLGWDDFSFKP